MKNLIVFILIVILGANANTSKAQTPVTDVGAGIQREKPSGQRKKESYPKSTFTMC